MRLKDYKTKLIVPCDERFLIKKTLPIKIEDKTYDFRIFDIKGPIIEFGVFIPYSSLKASDGPIERNLNDMLYYEIRNYEGFFSENFFFEPEFVLDGEKYTLKMAGSGPIALKLILYFTFSDIDQSNKPIEKKLRNMIVSLYEYKMRNDPNLKNRFEELLEKDKIEQENKEKNLNEVREKEKKMQEIEQEFDFYKPRDKSRYKIR